MKDINDAFYVSFINISNIVIYKYYYEKMMLEKINTINLELFDDVIDINYFYNELDKKEYLFIKGYQDFSLSIYLIKNEKNYELIYEQNDFDFNDFLSQIEIQRHSGPCIRNRRDINLFEIIYNQLDNNIYIISIYDIGYEKYYDYIYYSSKRIIINIFKENKLISSNFNYSYFNNTYANDLIYEDKNSNKYYILTFIEKIYRMIEIKKYNSDISTTKMSQKDEAIDINSNSDIKYIVYSDKDKETIKNFSFDGFIYSKIFYGYNGTFLYISKSNTKKISEIIVIDLFKKKIIKQFKIDIYINSFEYWGLKNILIVSDNSIYIFDKYTCQIIAKYSNICKGSINKIQAYISKENNFYGLIISSSSYEFILMNINKNK